MRLAALLISTFVSCNVGDGSAFGQQSTPDTVAGILAPGNAAVTGFAGAVPPVQIAPGVDPADRTFIDPNGASLRIIDLQQMKGLPQAQLVGASKLYSWFASQIGQVFAVALDDAVPPNMYAASTSAYGLPIVRADAGGELVHVRVGGPNATFMPGLWGSDAGPGTIFKINGATGAVTEFANVTLNGRTNSGAALGGMAFDPRSRSLYVADRESGFIHRFGSDGVERDHYDHGTAGRTVQHLPAVPFDPARRLDITSPQFDSGDPTTWNYAPPARRVFGLAVFRQRLYYAVAEELQVWSAGLGPDGSFGTDATLEIGVLPGSGPTEISKITFDEQGRMYLAERPAPTGARDFEALSVPGVGRVLRYTLVDSAPGAARIWVPDEYAIGFPSDMRNGNGGVAIGYRYDRAGELSRSSCGGFVWSSGEELRRSSDPALAARLASSGETDVDGLQGNETWRVRPDNTPPLASYFIGYSDEYFDQAARGHMGDIAIFMPCTPALPSSEWVSPGGRTPPGPHLPGYPKPPRGSKPPPPLQNPPGSCPPGHVRGSDGECSACTRPNVRVANRCCSPADLQPGGACAGGSGCAPGTTSVGGFCCNSSQVYAGPGGALACCSGQVNNGQCQQGSPPPAGPGCPPGFVPSGNTCCLANQMTATGICCPAGQAPSGPNKSQCHPIHTPLPPGLQCCPAGQVQAADGICCPVNLLTNTGICCPAGNPPDPNNRNDCPAKIQSLSVCAPGYTRMPDGSCCNNRFVDADHKTCHAPALPECGERGGDYIRNPENPRLCFRCRGDSVANEAHTACVPPANRHEHMPPRFERPPHVEGPRRWHHPGIGNRWWHTPQRGRLPGQPMFRPYAPGRFR